VPKAFTIIHRRIKDGNMFYICGPATVNDRSATKFWLMAQVH